MISKVNNILELVKNRKKNEAAADSFSSKSFNIFEVLGVESKEVTISRFIAWLLDPNGDHGQGILFLDSFFKNVLKPSTAYSKEQLSALRIETEYPVDTEFNAGARRIDIVLHDHKMFIPIEVKIYAGDQKAQCYDYYQFAHAKDFQSKLYYLTRYGYQPSESSLLSIDGKSRLVDENIRCISFQEDIWDWLSEAKTSNDLLNNLIEGFLKSISEFTGRKVMLKNQDISKILIRDIETFKTANEIAKAAEYAKVELMLNFFTKLSEEMDKIADKYNINKTTATDKAKIHESINKYYFNKLDNYPKFTYMFPNIDIAEGYCLSFNIELGAKYIYCGFRACNKKTGHPEKIKEGWKNKFNDIVQSPVYNSSSWLFSWDTLPCGGTVRNDGKYKHNFAKYVDCREGNDNFYNLVDSSYMTNFIKESVAYIEEKWLKVLK